MVNYEYGKIYKITSENSNLVYYGSTSEKYLSSRLSHHLSQYKLYLNGKGNYCSSYKLLEHEDYKMELIKNFPCANRTQLTTEEGNYVKKFECINIQIPGRTKKQYREQHKEQIKEQRKEYNIQNKKKIDENNKQYYQNNKKKVNEYREQNKQKIKEQKKQYREKQDKEKIKEYMKQYREQNKEKIKEQRKKYYDDNKQKTL